MAIYNNHYAKPHYLRIFALYKYMYDRFPLTGDTFEHLCDLFLGHFFNEIYTFALKFDETSRR